MATWCSYLATDSGECAILCLSMPQLASTITTNYVANYISTNLHAPASTFIESGLHAVIQHNSYVYSYLHMYMHAYRLTYTAWLLILQPSQRTVMPPNGTM